MPKIDPRMEYFYKRLAASETEGKYVTEADILLREILVEVYQNCPNSESLANKIVQYGVLKWKEGIEVLE